MTEGWQRKFALVQWRDQKATRRYWNGTKWGPDFQAMVFTDIIDALNYICDSDLSASTVIIVQYSNRRRFGP